MEQPHMMAMNGAPPQNGGGMQRAQAGNMNQQVFAKVIVDLQASMHQVGSGWQSTYDIKQRAAKIVQMFTALRLISTDMPQCLRMAMQFELKTIQLSPSREEYETGIQGKFEELRARRAQHANAQMQNGLQMPPGMAMPQNIPNNGMPDMNMANGMMGMPNGQMGHNSGPQRTQAFPAQLQRQMQPSAIPLAQQRRNMDASTLQTSATQLQTPAMGQEQGLSTPGMNMSGQGLQGPGQPTDREIQQMSQMLYNRMPEESRNIMRVNWLKSLNEDQRLHLNLNNLGGVDPLLAHFFPVKAREVLLKQRASQQGHMQQQGGGNMHMAGLNNGNGGNSFQPPTPQAGGPGIDYTSILGQQANALKQQESGETVVPASANNFGVVGAGSNIPQGINPQMMGNPLGHGQPVSNQMQQLMMQQQRQQHMQRQNIIAQQQAQQQQQQQQQVNQLRGQPGGLNAPNALNGGPAGQVNSPAMSMLNRPMVAPGQDTPDTPQQNVQSSQPSQTPQNAQTMHLMQHHQQMMNQNNQVANSATQGQNQQAQQRQQEMMQLLQTLPPQIRQRVIENNMSLENTRLLVTRMRQQQMNQQSGNVMNSQQGGPGMPTTSGIAQTSQQGVPNGTTGQSTQGIATPMFNSQPPPTQQPQAPQLDPVMLQQRFQQQQVQQQLRNRAMDARPFPPEVLGHIGVSVPPEVRSWGRLKSHLQQNSSVLPPNVFEKVRGMQNQWFQKRPEDMAAAYHALQNAMQLAQQQGQAQGPPAGQMQVQPQQPAVSNPAALQMPNGQAPPAQMVPPPAPTQMPPTPHQVLGTQAPNQGQLARPPIPQPPTLQEIQAARQRYPDLAGQSDESIANWVWIRKRQAHGLQMQQWTQQTQQQEAVRNQQIRSAQAAAAQQNGGLPNDAQAQGRRPPPQQQPPVQQQQAPVVPSPAQKRNQPPASSISNDDVMEIPNPNAPTHPQMSATQASMMQPNKPQPGPSQAGIRRPNPMPTKEQVAQMSPEQQAHFHQALLQQRQREKEQTEAIRKAQMGLPGPPQSQTPGQRTPGPQRGAVNTADVSQQAQIGQRLAAMFGEVERANPKGPAVSIGVDDLKQVQALAKRLIPLVSQLQGTFAMATKIPGSEPLIQEVMRVRVLFLHNFTDGNGTVKEFLALSLQQMRGADTVVQRYLHFMKMMKDRAAQQNQGQQRQQQQTSADQVHVAPPSQATQRPAAGAVKQERQPLKTPLPAVQQGHGRKPSGSKSKAPPAPTENKTFDFPSPHGGAQANSTIRNEFKSDQLVIPASRKRKTNQPGSPVLMDAGSLRTPGAAGSPNIGVGKVGSPVESKKPRKDVQDVKEEIKERQREEQRKWRCRDMLCQASVSGFEKEDELKRHVASEHMPVDDPLAFLTESAASALGVDQDGNLLQVEKVKIAAEVKPQSRAVTIPRARTGIKQETATPPGVGPVSNAKGKQTVTSVPTAPVAEMPIVEKSLREVLEARMGYVHHAATEDSGAATAKVSEPVKAVEGDESWNDLFDDTFDGAAGMDDIFSFTPSDNVDWGLPHYSDSSPDDSESTASSRTSDISANERLRINMAWDAFGNGDTHAPDWLDMKRLGVDSLSPQQSKDESSTKEGAGKDLDLMDWSGDKVQDWDTLFEDLVEDPSEGAQ